MGLPLGGPVKDSVSLSTLFPQRERLEAASPGPDVTGPNLPGPGRLSGAPCALVAAS